MLLTDLKEVKALLDIDQDDTTDDVKLNLLIEMASQWIEEFLGRVGYLEKKSRTEYYAGTGKQTILLKARPVFPTPTIEVYVDESGFFGSVSGSFDTTTSAFVYGTDFALQLDQEDGTSRSGLLVRINNVWPRPSARVMGLLSPFVAQSFGNVKVVYTAGYTTDSLPAALRYAAAVLVARMQSVLPLGVITQSEAYEERSISVVAEQKDYFLALIKPILYQYRNWRW